MRLSTVSRLVIILGVLVGGAAGLALVFGMGLDRIPPWMITIGLYKLTFIAAGGLLVVGAMLGRAARARAREANTSGRPPSE
jgi:hypothetical protein